jgi:hypothetical protein
MAKRRARVPEPIADEVLQVPMAAFEQIRTVVPNKRRKGKKPKRKTEPRFVAEEPLLEPYGGYDKFLVKTALIRPRGATLWDAPLVRTPDKVAEICKHMAYYDQEHMLVIALDGNSRMLALFEAAIGGSSRLETTIRHLLKVPLLTGASAAVVVHNHPSGFATPSDDDRRMTEKLKQAFDCVDVPLVDHIIVALFGWMSITDQDAFGKW